MNEEYAYSVLMSVYAGENPAFLQEAIDSMYRQTLPTDDFVLVCDGPLTDSLEAIATSAQQRFPDSFHVVRLPEHQGLAAGLNAGLRHCRHEFIARMDSDDISHPQRCEKQLARFREDPGLAILSGTVAEFEDTPAHITGHRTLPAAYSDICQFSRKRSPFNHPAVMYRKSAVLASGGYDEGYPYFEDYDLWIRMLQTGFRGENLREPILYMRAGAGMCRRRSGPAYARRMLTFHRSLRGKGWTSAADFLWGAVPHALVCLLPFPMVRQVYRALHRQEAAL